MEVILLEKIRNLGGIGDKAAVKAGYARNYLVPYGKAVVATAANLAKFAKMRDELEKKAQHVFEMAKERATKLESAAISIPMKATEEGKLFGSVSTGAISSALKEAGFAVEKSEVSLPGGPIRQVGAYDVMLILHTDVSVKIKLNVVPIASEQ